HNIPRSLKRSGMRLQNTSIVVTGSSTEYRLCWIASRNTPLRCKPFAAAERTASTARNLIDDVAEQRHGDTVPSLLKSDLNVYTQLLAGCGTQSFGPPWRIPNQVYGCTGGAWHLLKPVFDLLGDFDV